MAMRPLLLMRKKGLLSMMFGRHAHQPSPNLSKSSGSYWDVSGPGANAGPFEADFLAAYHALTSEQNVAEDGDILNLMPIGTLTSASVHADPILSLDFNGIYKERAINLPVWRGDRQVINLVADKDAPATEIIALKGGYYYIIQAKGTYNIDITGSVTATLSGTAEHKAIELKPVSDGDATFTVTIAPDEWQVEDLTPEALASGDLP